MGGVNITSTSLLLAAGGAAAIYISLLQRRLKDLSRTVERLEAEIRAADTLARKQQRPPPPLSPAAIGGQRLLIKHIQCGKFIAEGSFGAVHRGRWRGVPVALKFLKASDAPRLIEELCREGSVLHEIDHPHVMRLYGVCTDEAEVPPSWPNSVRPPMLVCEYLPGGNFVEFLRATAFQRDEKARHWRRVAGMLEGAAAGLEYLHGRSVVHRDMKSLNLFVDGRGRLKIGDFGLAKMYLGVGQGRQRIKRNDGSFAQDPGIGGEVGMIHCPLQRQLSQPLVVGTWTHIAPELMRAEAPITYSPAVDMFAFAIIIIEALGADEAEELVDETRVEVPHKKGEPPVFGINLDGVRSLLSEEWHCPETNALIDIVGSYGSLDPSDRPSAARLRSDLNRVRFAPVHLELQLKQGMNRLSHHVEME